MDFRLADIVVRTFCLNSSKSYTRRFFWGMKVVSNMEHETAYIPLHTLYIRSRYYLELLFRISSHF